VTGSSLRAYDPCPFYEPVGGVVLSGWTTLADHAAHTRLLAVDGPEIAPWNELASQLRRELGQRSIAVLTLDAREGMAARRSCTSGPNYSSRSSATGSIGHAQTTIEASRRRLIRRYS
jgi:hypothetical protein